MKINLAKSEKIIRNMNIPSCKNCIHFNHNIYNNSFSSSLNKCEKFGEKDIVTDKITYDFADSCRNDESKCGKDGKYFEEDKNVNLKLVTHTIFRPVSLFFLIPVSYLLSYYLLFLKK
jgi:hypothetical protein